MSRINVDQIKRDAKKYAKQHKVERQESLDVMARQHGFADWMDLRTAHRKQIAEDKENEPPMDPKAHLPPVLKEPVVLYKKKKRLEFK
jgi:hypothetical protein